MAFTFILSYDEGVSINGSFAEIGVVMLFPSSLLHCDLPVAHPLWIASLLTVVTLSMFP